MIESSASIRLTPEQLSLVRGILAAKLPNVEAYVFSTGRFAQPTSSNRFPKWSGFEFIVGDCFFPAE
jgi:hypothetical protein